MRVDPARLERPRRESFPQPRRGPGMRTATSPVPNRHPLRRPCGSKGWPGVRSGLRNRRTIRREHRGLRQLELERNVGRPAQHLEVVQRNHLQPDLALFQPGDVVAHDADPGSPDGADRVGPGSAGPGDERRLNVAGRGGDVGAGSDSAAPMRSSTYRMRLIAVLLANNDSKSPLVVGPITTRRSLTLRAYRPSTWPVTRMGPGLEGYDGAGVGGRHQRAVGLVTAREEPRNVRIGVADQDRLVERVAIDICRSARRAVSSPSNPGHVGVVEVVGRGQPAGSEGLRGDGRPPSRPSICRYPAASWSPKPRCCPR